MKRDELVERIVAMVEAHLDHDARVQHNVRLPSNDGSGSMRQCDVVIVTGTNPRETISIVEVQARQGKPTIGEFESWYAKMTAVGAQHLICVAEAGFPVSIERRAAVIGPSVRLVTLSEATDEISGWLDAVNGPPPVFTSVTYHKLLALEIVPFGLMKTDPDADLTTLDPMAPMFLNRFDEPVTPTALFDRQYFGNPQGNEHLPVGEDVKYRVTSPFERGDLRFRNWDGNLVPVREVSMAMAMRLDEHEVDWSGQMYHQSANDELGWILRGVADTPTGRVEVVVPFRSDPEAPGQYSLGRPRAISDHDIFLAVNGKGIPAVRIDDPFSVD